MDIKGFELIRGLLSSQDVDAKVRPPIADSAEVKYFGIAMTDLNASEIAGLGDLVCAQFTQVEFTGFSRGYYSFVDRALTDIV